MINRFLDFIIDELSSIDLEDFTIFAFVAITCIWVMTYFILIH